MLSKDDDFRIWNCLPKVELSFRGNSSFDLASGAEIAAAYANCIALRIARTIKSEWLSAHGANMGR